MLAGALSAPKLNKKKHDGHGSLRAQSVLFFSRVLAEGLKNCFYLLFATIVQTPEFDCSAWWNFHRCRTSKQNCLIEVPENKRFRVKYSDSSA